RRARGRRGAGDGVQLPGRRGGDVPRSPARCRRPPARGAAAPGRGRRAAWGGRAGDRAHRRGRCAGEPRSAGGRPAAPRPGPPAPAPRPRSTLPGRMLALPAPAPLDEAPPTGSALRDLHHREQGEYDQMAVVCRSGAAVADLADLLARTGLPVRVPHRPQPLREVPAIADLLSILEIGSAPADAPLDARRATELLRGPFGDADALRLRRIRRLLLAAHRAADPDSGTTSEQLLARALVEEDVPGLPAPEARDRAAAP